MRQESGRRIYGLAQATSLREARVTFLCAAKTVTTADRLASRLNAALPDVRHKTSPGQG